MWNGIKTLGTDIGGFFGKLGTDIGGWFGNVIDNVGRVLADMGAGFTNVISNLGSVLDYINPLSDKFFLKLAFVPSQDYMTAYKDDFNTAINNKFAFFYQVKDMFDALVSSVQANIGEWSGIQVDFTQYNMGQITIIDPQFANAAIPKLKFWIGGFMYFMTSMFIIRKVSNVLGAGKG